QQGELDPDHAHRAATDLSACARLDLVQRAQHAVGARLFASSAGGGRRSLPRNGRPSTSLTAGAAARKIHAFPAYHLPEPMRGRPGMSAAATLHAIHDQGGLAFAAHPFWRTEGSRRRRSVHGVGWLAAELDFDAIEVENATPGFYLFNQLAARLNVGAGKASL